MGNFFSQFENDVDKIIRAPSGQYTVTPAATVESSSVTSPAVSETTNSNQSPSESPNSDDKCVKPN